MEKRWLFNQLWGAMFLYYRLRGDLSFCLIVSDIHTILMDRHKAHRCHLPFLWKEMIKFQVTYYYSKKALKTGAVTCIFSTHHR